MDTKPEREPKIPFLNAVAGRAALGIPDVPKQLRSTLLLMALMARDDAGRGMFPSHATLARLSGKSSRQIGRIIYDLEQLGFIVRGDQKLTAFMGVGHRTIVYDLCTAVAPVPDPVLPSRKREPVKRTKATKAAQPITIRFTPSEFNALWSKVRAGYVASSAEESRCTPEQSDKLMDAEALAIKDGLRQPDPEEDED